MQFVTLSNGVKMPIIGYGVYQVGKNECEQCVLDALSVGYRHIDTAQSYFNEEQVGNAVAKSGINRHDIFITTKVWIEHYGHEQTKQSVAESMRKLKTDYIDLVLLHQPFSDVYGAWHALEDLYRQGVVRAIGVSNFYPDRLVDICSFAEIKPMVNQVETHPHNQQIEAGKWMHKYCVQHEAWASFGEGRNGLFTEPTLVQIGNRYGKTAAQVMLRWAIQRNIVVLPKSVTRTGWSKTSTCLIFHLPMPTWHKSPRLIATKVPSSLTPIPAWSSGSHAWSKSASTTMTTNAKRKTGNFRHTKACVLWHKQISL